MVLACTVGAPNKANWRPDCPLPDFEPSNQVKGTTVEKSSCRVFKRMDKKGKVIDVVAIYSIVV